MGQTVIRHHEAITDDPFRKHVAYTDVKLGRDAYDQIHASLKERLATLEGLKALA
jgi:hypothetical protein